MQRARSFFFVCLGILALAVAYHLGVRSAIAQSGGTVDLATVDVGLTFAVSGRVVYCNCGGSGEFIQLPGSVPGASRIVGVGQFCISGVACRTRVVLASGEIYDQAGSGWNFAGSVFGGGTPAQRESWGAVKQRYR